MSTKEKKTETPKKETPKKEAPKKSNHDLAIEFRDELEPHIEAITKIMKAREGKASMFLTVVAYENPILHAIMGSESDLAFGLNHAMQENEEVAGFITDAIRAEFAINRRNRRKEELHGMIGRVLDDIISNPEVAEIINPMAKQGKKED